MKNNMIKNKNQFEGWYFKNQTDKYVLALIPGINRTGYKKSQMGHADERPVRSGSMEAFLQIFAGDRTYFLPYHITECSIDSRNLIIRMGNNIFSKKGIHLEIDRPDIKISGNLYYGKLHPLLYSAMGFLKYLPYMECRHEIISMTHKVKGTVIVNGRKIRFKSGTGFLEKDAGTSFPKSYHWIQCNRFDHADCSILVALAEIPYLGFHIKGCMALIHYRGREYRLTTYLGAKILSDKENYICIRQGRYQLKIILNPLSPQRDGVISEKPFSVAGSLLAPDHGRMIKTIEESHLFQARFILCQSGKALFDLASSDVSVEKVD